MRREEPRCWHRPPVLVRDMAEHSTWWPSPARGERAPVLQQVLGQTQQEPPRSSINLMFTPGRTSYPAATLWFAGAVSPALSETNEPTGVSAVAVFCPLTGN